MIVGAEQPGLHRQDTGSGTSSSAETTMTRQRKASPDRPDHVALHVLANAGLASEDRAA